MSEDTSNHKKVVLAVIRDPVTALILTPRRGWSRHLGEPFNQVIEEALPTCLRSKQ